MFDEAGQWDWEYVQADSEQVSGSSLWSIWC
jgi:hypothetical protein